MRILMLGNSFTFANDMPGMLAELTGAEVVQHTRGGARLAEQLKPKTKNGRRTQAALEDEFWDYVVLQEMSNGPILYRSAFLKSVEELCDRIREEGATPVLFATWPYQRGSHWLEELGMTYDMMADRLYEAYHEAADENNALVADVGQRFRELADTRELYAEDGKHPNLAGSRVAAETIAEVIRADREREQMAAATEIEVDPNLNRNDIRLRVLYMYNLLRQYTDAEHQLTTNEIRRIMEREHGITMHRTTVPGDIEMLKAAGFDVHARRSRQNRYYIDRSAFELPELKILIDAVESSKFITEKKSRLLVDKLLTLTNEANADKLKRNLHTSGRVRSGNEKGYYIVDAINEAINERKRVSFYYTDYDGRKKPFLRNGGNPYVVSPYMLIWSGDFYYLVGWNHLKDAVRTFRVDRIAQQPVILETEAQPEPAGFDVSMYAREVFRMYDKQEPVEVRLLCRNDIMKGVIDQFGMDVKVKKAGEEHFQIRVKVCLSPTFYSWVFQWEGRVKIEGPRAAVKGYREMLRKAVE